MDSQPCLTDSMLILDGFCLQRVKPDILCCDPLTQCQPLSPKMRKPSPLLGISESL